MTTVFLHGLDSSSKGTKARWFRARFPAMVVPDFTGTLGVRMARLEEVLAGRGQVVLIGSSFGGLMATLFALAHERRVSRVILLAPALNFPELKEYKLRAVPIPARLYIGSRDTVCPPDLVVPLARQIFSNLFVQVSDDDHLLRSTFSAIDWQGLLEK